MIANFEKVKSLVESSISQLNDHTADGPVIEAATLYGTFGEDMTRSCEISMMENVVEFNEFVTGVNSMMIEAAIDQNEDQLAVLQEAAEGGIIQRVQAAIAKFIATLKALAARFKAWILANLGAAKAWLKMNKSKVASAEATGFKVKMHAWDKAGIDSLASAISSNVINGFGPGFTTGATDMDDLQPAIINGVIPNSGAKTLDDVKNYICKTAGCDGEKVEVNIGAIRTDALAIVENAEKNATGVANVAESLRKQAETLMKEWRSWKQSNREELKDADVKDNANACMSALAFTQKVYNTYATSCQKVFHNAMRENMLALNALVAGKKPKEPKAAK